MVLAAMALIARGILLGRPVMTMYATAAVLFVLAGMGRCTRAAPRFAQ